MQEIVIKVKKLHEDAIMPTREEGDAGWDLFAIEDIEIHPGTVITIHTGIALGIPKGYRVNIRDRSSMGVQGLTVVGGVIDQAYIGELIVCLANIESHAFIKFVFDGIYEAFKGVVSFVRSTLLGEKTIPFAPPDLDYSTSSYFVCKGDKIAQFVIEEDPQFASLLEVDELKTTKRGDKGFGSSGR